MADTRCVVNSSPLIVFERIGKFDLLPVMLIELFVPPAVRREVFGEKQMPAWIVERALTQPLASKIVSARLGAGEREAIALALEMQATLLVLDDLTARRLAVTEHTNHRQSGLVVARKGARINFCGSSVDGSNAKRRFPYFRKPVRRDIG